MDNWFWVVIIPFAIGLILLFVEYRSGIFVPKKNLKVEILVDAPLFSVHVYKGYEGKIDVYFDGVPVDNLSIFALRFSNAGRMAIKSEDYEKPLNINFVHPTSIKQIDIASSNPSNLPITYLSTIKWVLFEI
ncbi:MAG: hypothetical protein CL608_18105 [Anaerolineaceae bacterium]|nr:hypothetical protein [Anaerolineaceae bacterium]